MRPSTTLSLLFFSSPAYAAFTMQVDGIIVVFCPWNFPFFCIFTCAYFLVVIPVVTMSPPIVPRNFFLKKKRKEKFLPGALPTLGDWCAQCRCFSFFFFFWSSFKSSLFLLTVLPWALLPLLSQRNILGSVSHVCINWDFYHHFPACWGLKSHSIDLALKIGGP